MKGFVKYIGRSKSRRDKDNSLRRTVDEGLFRYSLMKIRGDVSTNFLLHL